MYFFIHKWDLDFSSYLKLEPFVMSWELMFVLDLSSQDENSNIQTQHGNGHWWKHLSGHCQKDISKIL